MPTSKTTSANTVSEPMRQASVPRPPGLTPLERQLLDQLVRVEQEAQAREARLEQRIMSLEMQLASTNGTVSTLTVWLGALLGPEEPSGS